MNAISNIKLDWQPSDPAVKALVEELWLSGQSYSIIATRFHRTTKGMIAGVVTRMKLPRRNAIPRAERTQKAMVQKKSGIASDEQVALLLDLNREGRTLVDIALIMNVNRNTVARKLRELNVPLLWLTQPKMRRRGAAMATAVFDKKVAERFVKAERPVVAVPTLQTASSHWQCQFPLWGHRERPTMRFCSAAAPVGASWCAEHRKVVFNKRNSLND